MHRARHKTIHLSDYTCTYICSRVLLEMCRFGKHAICIDVCVGYNLLNNIQLIVGIVGIVLLSIGLRLVSSVDVVVGKMPVAWVLGMLTAIVGGSCLLLCTTLFVAACMSRHEKDEKAEEVHRNRLLQFVVPFLAATLLLSSGLFNVLYHPRQTVICPCADNFYGMENGTVLSTCLPCNCGQGTCSSGRDGNGDCLCPDRYDPESQCQECIPGAEGTNCERCKFGWDYTHASGSCAGCVPGYEEPCDYTFLGANQRVCALGWETQCTREPTKIYPWYVEALDCPNGVCPDNLAQNCTLLCDRCAKGYSGLYCSECPECNLHFAEAAVCQENLPRSRDPIVGPAICSKDQDCVSMQCVIDDVLGVCATGIRVQTQCNCNTVGFPVRSPDCIGCPGTPYAGVGSPCNEGTCVLQGKTAKCMCPAGWQGERCAKNTVTGQCKVNFFGLDCQPCTCSSHGVCDWGVTGDGECRSCDYSPSVLTGIGMWTGVNCNECAGGKDFVGCNSEDWVVGDPQTCRRTPTYQRHSNCGASTDCVVGQFDQNPCAPQSCTDSVYGLFCENTCNATRGGDWESLGCDVVDDVVNATTVTGLGEQKAAEGWLSCEITCPVNKGEFVVHAVQSEGVKVTRSVPL